MRTQKQMTHDSYDTTVATRIRVSGGEAFRKNSSGIESGEGSKVAPVHERPGACWGYPKRSTPNTTHIKKADLKSVKINIYATLYFQEEKCVHQEDERNRKTRRNHRRIPETPVNQPEPPTRTLAFSILVGPPALFLAPFSNTIPCTNSLSSMVPPSCLQICNAKEDAARRCITLGRGDILGHKKTEFPATTYHTNRCV